MVKCAVTVRRGSWWQRRAQSACGKSAAQSTERRGKSAEHRAPREERSAQSACGKSAAQSTERLREEQAQHKNNDSRSGK